MFQEAPVSLKKRFHNVGVRDKTWRPRQTMSEPNPRHALAYRKNGAAASHVRRVCLLVRERHMGNTGVRRPQVLYVGNEPLLSKATSELLKRSGYKVRTSNPVHAGTILRDEKFSAVILCATLSGAEADELVDLAFRNQPETSIVSVHLGLLGDAPNPRSTVVVDALKGPDELVNAVHTASQQLPGKLVSKAV